MQRMQQNPNAILQIAMNYLGLTGRDPQTLSAEEKVNYFYKKPYWYVCFL
jgi:hypothetical protein